METGKKLNGDAFILSLRQKVKEMKQLVIDKEYEILLSATDKQWLNGITTRLDKKVKIMELNNEMKNN